MEKAGEAALGGSEVVALVRGAQRGDPRAFRGLFDRYQRSVMSYCLLSSNRDRELAKDLTQECFARAFASLGSLADPERFQGWLFTLAANTCRTRGAQRARHQKLLESVMLEHEAAPDGADPVEREQIIARVREVLDHVADPTVRQIALLHYVEGRTTRTIASELDVPHGTVTVKLMRFRAAIKRDLCRALAEEGHP